MATLVFASISVLALATNVLASPVTENVPVPGGIVALARALDIDAPDRARCLPEVVRLVFGDNQFGRGREDSPYRRLLLHFASVDAAGSTRAPTDLVPVPLTAAVWSRAVFQRPVSSAMLFTTILSDANAALLAYGLSGLDDETLTFLVEHPDLLTSIYRRHAIAFASYATHFRIHNNRVVVPGGQAAVPLWEGVLQARIAEPVRFTTALLGNAKGRIAYLYDLIAHLDDARRAFALGIWLKDASVRLARFQALSHITTSMAGEWNAMQVAFSRPAFDLLSLLQRVQTDRSGTPRAPALRSFWAPALSDDQIRSPQQSSNDRTVMDAAWLAEIVLQGDGGARSRRLNQFAFGQRAFAGLELDASADAIAAIRTYQLTPMLTLSLEQMGVRNPQVYVALAHHAQRLTTLDAAQEHTALAQFQGAVALVARMAQAQTIDAAVVERWLRALAQVEIDASDGYVGGIAAWLLRHVRPALASGGVSLDSDIVRALAGPAADSTTVAWEGQSYAFNLTASEENRLRRLTQHRRAASLESAVQLYTDATVPGAAGGPGASGAARVQLRAVDRTIADAFLSLVYAIHSSEPHGLARLDREVHRRHDFGLTSPSRAVRAHMAWALPRLAYRPGHPWRVEGALLGLDVALAPLALRRISMAPPSREPRLLSTNRYTFATSLGLINQFAWRDVDADAIAAAVVRGERRIEALTAGSADIDVVVDQIRLDGWRARALRWNLVHSPDEVSGLFSLTELLHLGGGRDHNVDAFGMSGLDVHGCLCTFVAAPGMQTAVVGRHQLGLLAVAVPDLNLRVAIVLRELQLPVSLSKYVLDAALYDLVTETHPSHHDDWLSIVRSARSLSRERVEDYFAAVTASTGPLTPAHSARRQP